MRPIDADVLKKDLTRFYNGEVVARKLIDEQPTVDAAPVVHGRWIMVQGELAFWDKCSECGKKILHRTPYYDFCPNCGALMEVEHGRPD